MAERRRTRKQTRPVAGPRPQPSTPLPPRRQDPEQLLLEMPDVEVRTGLSRSHLYEEMKRGRLRYVKVGRRRLVRKVDLEAYVETLSRAAP
jgi:excisionase family DNA binding protein